MSTDDQPPLLIRLRAWLRFEQCMAHLSALGKPHDAHGAWREDKAAAMAYWIDEALLALHSGGWHWGQGEWGPYWFKRLVRRLCLCLPSVDVPIIGPQERTP